jgi:hypothetical protein
MHPSFFPLDPFHLFYENCMVHIWDLWVTYSSDDEQIHMDAEMASNLGKEIEQAMATPPFIILFTNSKYIYKAPQPV